MNNREKIAKLLTTIALLYRVEYDELALELDVNALEDLGYEELKQAASLWRRENRWPPAVSDLRDYVAIVQRMKREQAQREQERRESQELERCRLAYKRIGALWDTLSDTEKTHYKVQAQAHPLSDYGWSKETIARIIFAHQQRLLPQPIEVHGHPESR